MFIRYNPPQTLQGNQNMRGERMVGHTDGQLENSIALTNDLCMCVSGCVYVVEVVGEGVGGSIIIQELSNTPT